jgi:hypothetical protein
MICGATNIAALAVAILSMLSPGFLQSRNSPIPVKARI